MPFKYTDRCPYLFKSIGRFFFGFLIVLMVNSVTLLAGNPLVAKQPPEKMIFSSGHGGTKQALPYLSVPSKPSKLLLSLSTGILSQFIGPTSNLRSETLSPTHHTIVGSSDYRAATAFISGAPPSKPYFELALLYLSVAMLPLSLFAAITFFAAFLRRFAVSVLPYRAAAVLAASCWAL